MAARDGGDVEEGDYFGRREDDVGGGRGAGGDGGVGGGGGGGGDDAEGAGGAVGHGCVGVEWRRVRIRESRRE